MYLSGDLIAGFHAASGENISGGPDLGLDLLFRFRILEAGLLLDTGGPIFGSGNRSVAGGLLGLGSHGDGPFGGDLLLEGGAHTYSGIGSCGFCFDGDAGAGGSVGFVGARAGLTVQQRHEHKPWLLTMGLWAWADVDTSSRQVTYTYVPTCLLDCTATPVTQTVAIGGVFEVGLAFRIGFDVQVNARQFARDDDKGSVPSSSWDDERP
jgi:hypothetical protein